MFSPYLVEAAQLLADGYQLEEIDAAAVNFGMPMGPLRLLDEIGLDIAAKVSKNMEEDYGARMAGPNYAQVLLDKGLKGRKSGAGFYLYNGKVQKPNPEIKNILNLSGVDRKVQTNLEKLAERLILAMVNEAIRCLTEGIAGSPGKDAAGQVDLGSVMGMGFAPFHGGIIHYAESLGAKKLFERLSTLSKKHGARFAPVDGIAQRAKDGKSFYESA